MTDPIACRPATEADAARIAALLSDEGYPAGASDIVERLERFESPSGVIVATAAGEVVGFVAVHVMPRFEHPDRVARILAFVVDPGVRERGVGRLLLAQAEAHAAEWGCAFVETTAGHHRADAKRLLEGAGFDPSLTGYFRKRLVQGA